MYLVTRCYKDPVWSGIYGDRLSDSAQVPPEAPELDNET